MTTSQLWSPGALGLYLCVSETSRTCDPWVVRSLRRSFRSTDSDRDTDVVGEVEVVTPTHVLPRPGKDGCRTPKYDVGIHHTCRVYTVGCIRSVCVDTSATLQVDSDQCRVFTCPTTSPPALRSPVFLGSTVDPSFLGLVTWGYPKDM